MNPELPLRDIHLPPAVGWWPLAPGWYALAVGILALLLFGWWLWRRLRRVTVVKATLRQLDAIAARQQAPVEQVRELALVLRRACLSAYPREDVAGLTGEDWLRFLDQSLPERPFSEGPGRLLLDAPYRPHCDGDLKALLDLCRAWARRLPTVTLGKA